MINPEAPFDGEDETLKGPHSDDQHRYPIVLLIIDIAALGSVIALLATLYYFVWR